jgi:hypothetical protein
MGTTPQKLIPVYSSRGDLGAYLFYPHLYNAQGEWIGWVTPEREIYSVLGYYVGDLTNEPRILRKRVLERSRPRQTPPPHPERIQPLATVPLARLMRELYHDTIDVLLDEPERLHTVDTGEYRDDLD